MAGYGFFKKKRDSYGRLGGSYKFVQRPSFGVVRNASNSQPVRDASNSQQIVKSRPLVIDETKLTDDMSSLNNSKGNMNAYKSRSESKAQSLKEVSNMEIRIGEDKPKFDPYANFDS